MDVPCGNYVAVKALTILKRLVRYLKQQTLLRVDGLRLGLRDVEELSHHVHVSKASWEGQ